MPLSYDTSGPNCPRRLTASPKPHPECVQTPDPEPLPDILTWVRDHLHFSPDLRQAEVLTSDTNRLILCCTRQWGKSTITALKALHLALAQPGAEILCVSRSERQSREWLRKLKTFARKLDLPLKSDAINRGSWLAPNGSRIVALPAAGDTSVGFSNVSLLVIDEAARVPDSVYYALRPSLIRSNGRLWLLSTPFGQRGFFYEEWSALDRPWTRFRLTATDCPAITQEALDEQRRALGEAWFNQEFFCQFNPTSGALLTRAIIEAALDPSILPLFGGRRP